MKVARAGLPFIMAGFVFTVIGAFMTQNKTLAVYGTLISLTGAAFTFFCAYFFRDPERPLPGDPEKIYSPGDGRVLSVAREEKGEIVTLRIFLSIFNVHIQRIPCSGIVQDVEYRSGSFKAAMNKEARYNERSVVHLDPGNGREPLVFEQIAGLIARRIVCWAKKGQVYVAGQRYGLIRFGSQVAVHFPPSARCTVKPGDRVVGGVTIVGEWTKKP